MDSLNLGYIAVAGIIAAVLVVLVDFQRLGYLDNMMILLFLFLGGATAGSAHALGYNISGEIAIATSLVCAIIAFQWGINRYADRALPLRGMMGLLYGCGSWFSTVIIKLMTFVGWEPAIEIISETPWGMPSPSQDSRVKSIMETTIGSQSNAEILEVGIKAAIAAIPELDVRKTAQEILEKDSSAALEFLMRPENHLKHLLPPFLDSHPQKTLP